MRNILLFFRSASNLFFFLFLQGICFYFIASYNRYHNNLASATLSEIAGKVNNQVNKVNYYTNLKTENDKFLKEHEKLRNNKLENFENADTAMIIKSENPNDTLGLARKWQYRGAKVISNSVSGPNNFIVVHRGSRQGIAKGMAVVNYNDELVGKVVNVSDNYAVIMNLLHKGSIISCKLKNGGNTGFAKWDGKSINELNFEGISKTVGVNIGDTILTTGFTSTFKAGFIVGFVKEVSANKSSNQHKIITRTAINFQSLEFVYIIENLQQKEADQILKETINQL